MSAVSCSHICVVEDNVVVGLTTSYSVVIVVGLTSGHQQVSDVTGTCMYSGYNMVIFVRFTTKPVTWWTYQKVQLDILECGWTYGHIKENV